MAKINKIDEASRTKNQSTTLNHNQKNKDNNLNDKEFLELLRKKLTEGEKEENKKKTR